MKALLTLILFLIYQAGIGQGIDTNCVIITDSVITLISGDRDEITFPVGKWGKITNTNYLIDIQKVPYVIEIINDNNLFITTEDHGKEVFQDFIDRHLVESWTRQWEAYQQECWNDSTFKKNNDWCFETKRDAEFEMKLVILWGLKNHVIEQKNDTCYQIGWYNHKQPTFEGFMEYLERRIK